MDTVMAAFIASAVMDSASGNNGHIRPLSDIKVIINHVPHSGSIHHHWNVHLFPLRLTVYENVNALFTFLLLNLNMLTVTMTERNTVMPQVKRALLFKSCAVNLPQNLFCNLIQ